MTEEERYQKLANERHYKIKIKKKLKETFKKKHKLVKMLIMTL